MMVKITTGSSFSGAIKYDEGKLGKEQEYETIGCEGIDMSYGPFDDFVHDVDNVARSFRLQASLNPNVSKPVKHFAISWHPDDAPSLTNQVIMDAVRAYLKEMGYDQTQYLVTRHKGTDNPHCHVIANVVDNNGKRINDYMERRRSAEACKKITAEMNFTWGSHKSARQSQIPNDCYQRTRESVKYDIARDLAKAIAEVRRIEQLPGVMKSRYDITEDMRYDRVGKPCGISFSKEARDHTGRTMVFSFAGSTIDRSFSCRNINALIRMVDKFPALVRDAANTLRIYDRFEEKCIMPKEIIKQHDKLLEQIRRVAREERRLVNAIPRTVIKGTVATILALNFYSPLGALTVGLASSLVLAHHSDRLTRVRGGKYDLLNDLSVLRNILSTHSQQQTQSRGMRR